ncbi:L,D-transpeptidase [Pseudonocardia acaciae]|uniref:L,D-transpeptidase n=1 Tax=Pseudonocardia acaciae TaxID=551276 RepID=UPI000A030FAC|nr:Ig-like domain-containing protein [Pseudonocardia acaciae]
MRGASGAFKASEHNRGRATIALGLATAVVAALALITATEGPAAIRSVAAPPPPPVPPAEIAISPAAGTAVNPSVPLGVEVSHGTLRAVDVTDTKTGKKLAGEIAAGAASWHSTAPLSYADSYQVAATAVGADGRVFHQNGTVNTIKPGALAFPSFVPVPSHNGVGVGQPVVVKFDHPVTDKAAAERAMTVTSNPPQQGGWYWISASEAHYRPKAYWQPGSTVTVTANMFGVDLGKGVFGQTNRSETLQVHDSWIAKADGATEQMRIFHNGALVNTMPISLGSKQYPSHIGPHVVTEKMPTMTMDSCTYGVCEGQPGYYKEKVDLDVRISNDGEFVHSAPWSTGQQGSSNVSHGCVNLAPANAQWFFDHFGTGDVVEITNSGGPPLPVYDTYGDWELDWAHWQSGSALH